MSVHSDAADRYADACDRRRHMLEEWVELGSPLLGVGGATGQAVVPHPMVAMLREADALCDRLAKSLKSAQMGRPVGSASAVDRVEDSAPPVVLRVAK